MNELSPSTAAAEPKPDISRRKRFLILAFVVGAVFFTLALSSVILFGSIGAGVAKLRGRPLFVDKVKVWVGRVAPDEKKTTTFTVRNLTSAPIELVGAKTSCGCMLVDEFPIIVAPYAAEKLNVSLNMDERYDVFEVFARVYSDHPNGHFVLTVTGYCRADGETAQDGKERQ